MRLPRAARPTASLFAQVFGLIAVSLAATYLLNLLLVFSLPAPVPDFYRIHEVALTFEGRPPAFGERRPLVKIHSATPPGPPMQGRFVPTLRARLAQQLNVPQDHIALAAHYNSPFTDRRAFRVMRERMNRAGAPNELFFAVPFAIGVKSADGGWTEVRPQHGAWLDPWQERMALWFVLSALAVAPLAYLFARRLSAPIRRFAQAAERLGRDPRAPPLSLDGSAEIGVATQAFNDMQERLRRYVEDRTAMVGAIAHDLRTPLTRLRFRIENVPEDQRAKMAADIDQMEEMIAAALAFVRDASRPGERTPLELSSLLESLCDEMAETGADTEVATGDKVVIEGDPLALRRLFANLLDNAVKFGGQARARVFREGPDAIVEIADAGPGIPACDAERVFEPFYRREPSRSRQTGGIGLGLAVARSIARGHGGDVDLDNRVLGGLTVRVHLPV